MEEKNIKELFAEWGLWSLVEDISDDGDGVGDNLQLTKEGLEAQRMIEQELDQAREEVEDKFTAKLKKREEEMNVPYSEEDGKEFWQGYQEGYHQGLQDMVIDKYYLDEEFQSKLTTK